MHKRVLAPFCSTSYNEQPDHCFDCPVPCDGQEIVRSHINEPVNLLLGFVCNRVSLNLMVCSPLKIAISVRVSPMFKQKHLEKEAN